ncbi:MAG: 4-hydroxybenzoate octaprenyltransferase [Candidatus Pelagibacter sp.]|nr:4-hydroxybenzoate octaprenyltransferase [Candidatus Pelagibacter sp.]|tara:strand:- start:3992 stop:4843 length:852 start_codon:yes stop_codon:yes gene_type:complete
MKNYIYLMRLNKPTGFLLLFWPCSWGMAYNLNYLPISSQWFYYLFLFFAGSILMRSAGCIYNDIVDKEIDKKVERTKNRPLATGKINLRDAWILILILCFLSLIILFQFNNKTILFGLSVIFIVLLYPFAKRFTYWPQLILGIVFNFGIILSWLSLNENFITGIILLYLSGIMWTVGYDTIYALQDVVDDKKIGVKSLALLLDKKTYQFLYIIYTAQIFLLISSLLLANNFSVILFLLSIPYLLILRKIYLMKNLKNYLEVFQFNNYFGFLILLILLSVRIYN